jgi:hypothetical protein
MSIGRLMKVGPNHDLPLICETPREKAHVPGVKGDVEQFAEELPEEVAHSLRNLSGQAREAWTLEVPFSTQLGLACA